MKNAIRLKLNILNDRRVNKSDNSSDSKDIGRI